MKQPRSVERLTQLSQEEAALMDSCPILETDQTKTVLSCWFSLIWTSYQRPCRSSYRGFSSYNQISDISPVSQLGCRTQSCLLAEVSYYKSDRSILSCIKHSALEKVSSYVTFAKCLSSCSQLHDLIPSLKQVPKRPPLYSAEASSSRQPWSAGPWTDKGSERVLAHFPSP